MRSERGGRESKERRDAPESISVKLLLWEPSMLVRDGDSPLIAREWEKKDSEGNQNSEAYT